MITLPEAIRLGSTLDKWKKGAMYSLNRGGGRCALELALLAIGRSDAIWTEAPRIFSIEGDHNQVRDNIFMFNDLNAESAEDVACFCESKGYMGCYPLTMGEGKKDNAADQKQLSYADLR